MFKKLLGVGMAAITTVVAACDGASTTQQVFRRHEDILSFVRDATIKGPMLVQVVGNPFSARQSQLDDIVVEEIEKTITEIRGVKFTTDPDAAAEPKFRMILVLGAPKTLSAASVCEDPLPTVEPIGDKINMVAVFCHKDVLYSEVRGSMQTTATPDDKAFRKWVGQISRDLFLSFAGLLMVSPIGL